jgi:hypothetical protein
VEVRGYADRGEVGYRAVSSENLLHKSWLTYYIITMEDVDWLTQITDILEIWSESIEIQW